MYQLDTQSTKNELHSTMFSRPPPPPSFESLRRQRRLKDLQHTRASAMANGTQRSQVTEMVSSIRKAANQSREQKIRRDNLVHGLAKVFLIEELSITDDILFLDQLSDFPIFSKLPDQPQQTNNTNNKNDTTQDWNIFDFGQTVESISNSGFAESADEIQEVIIIEDHRKVEEAEHDPAICRKDYCFHCDFESTVNYSSL